MGTKNSKSTAAFAKPEVDKHTKSLCEGLNNLREDETHCDTIIWCRGEGFNVHKCVLAASCPYFREILSSSSLDNYKSEINLDDVKPEGVEQLINYLYTGQAYINANNVQQVMQVCKVAKVDALYNQCRSILERELNLPNFVEIWNVADQLGDTSLRKTVIEYAACNFGKVCEHQSFGILSTDRLQCLLQDNSLIISQDKQLEAVLSWVRVKLPLRQTDLPSMLDIITPEGFRLNFLETLEKNEPLAESDSNLKRFLKAAKKWATTEEFLFLSDGNANRDDVSPSSLLLIFAENELNQTMMQSFNLNESKWSDTHFVAPFGDVRLVGTTVYNNRIFCAGGKITDEEYSNTFYGYDVLDYDLHLLSPMQVSRALLSLTVYDGCIYAVGGYNSDGYISAVERYVIPSDDWQQVASLKEPRSGATCIAVNDRMYTFGGRGDHGILATVEYYSAATDQWTSVAPMLFPRSHCGVGVIRNKVYLVGGFWSVQDQVKSSVGCIQCLDVNCGSWSLLDAGVSTSSMVSNVIKWRDMLYLLTISGHVYIFNPIENKLRKLRRNPRLKNRIRAAFVVERKNHRLRKRSGTSSSSRGSSESKT